MKTLSRIEMKNISGGTHGNSDCTAVCHIDPDTGELITVQCSGETCEAIDGQGCIAWTGDTPDAKDCDTDNG